MKPFATAIAACAWLLVCAYLYGAWPSLAPVLDVDLPRAAFPALGLAAPLGLYAKDRWLSASLALLVDAVVAAPPLLAIGLFLYPFLVPVE